MERDPCAPMTQGLSIIRKRTEQADNGSLSPLIGEGWGEGDDSGHSKPATCNNRKPVPPDISPVTRLPLPL